MPSRRFYCPQCADDALLMDDARCSWCLYRTLPRRIEGDVIQLSDVFRDPRYFPRFGRDSKRGTDSP